MAHELLDGTGIDIAIDLSGAASLDGRLTPEAAHELRQIAREALSNVARHSGAGQARIALLVEGDDADPVGRGRRRGLRSATSGWGAATSGSPTCAIGQPRSAATLTIDSGQGEGTRIIVRLPARPFGGIARDGSTTARS